MALHFSNSLVQRLVLITFFSFPLEMPFADWRNKLRLVYHVSVDVAFFSRLFLVNLIFYFLYSFQNAGTIPFTSSSRIETWIFFHASFVSNFEIFTRYSCCSCICHVSSCFVFHFFACYLCCSNVIIVLLLFVRFFCCFF